MRLLRLREEKTLVQGGPALVAEVGCRVSPWRGGAGSSYHFLDQEPFEEPHTLTGMCSLDVCCARGPTPRPPPPAGEGPRLVRLLAECRSLGLTVTTLWLLWFTSKEPCFLIPRPRAAPPPPAILLCLVLLFQGTATTWPWAGLQPSTTGPTSARCCRTTSSGASSSTAPRTWA